MTIDENLAAMVAIRAKPSRFTDLFDKGTAVARTGFSKKGKYFRLLAVVDELGKRLDPLTPCKSGCSHCCHMSTAISDSEAQRISEHIRKPFIPQFASRDPNKQLEAHAAMVEKYTAVPCVFLKENKCTIYEVRPYACRIHHSLDEDNSKCDLYKTPREATPSLNCHELNDAYATIFMHENWGDIRDYFPKGKGD